LSSEDKEAKSSKARHLGSDVIKHGAGVNDLFPSPITDMQIGVD
jgi:hypothetical protein